MQSKKKHTKPKYPGKTKVILYTLPKHLQGELDLHGKTVEEGLELLDKYIDTAYLYGMNPLRIIHGHGTGRLRKAVHDYLQHHPLVSRFYGASSHAGGDGATTVWLKLSPLIL